MVYYHYYYNNGHKNKNYYISIKTNWDTFMNCLHEFSPVSAGFNMNPETQKIV